jgi:hypothetical protein
MTRTLTTVALLALLALATAGPVLADGAAEKPASAEKAGQEAEAAGGEKADETRSEDPKPALKEFHLDLDDIKDLEEADIVLPNLDELEEDAGKDKPEGETAENEETEEEIDINPTEVVERIIDNMGQAATRLTQEKDPGEKTIEVETKVIDDLSDLIEWVKQQQAQSQSQQQQQQRQSAQDSQRQQQRRRQQRQRRQRQQTARQQRRSTQPMQDEMATKGQVQEGELADISEMLEERWGDLLPNRPRETMQSIQNMILQEYVDLLDRYYYSLAKNKPQAEEED